MILAGRNVMPLATKQVVQFPSQFFEHVAGIVKLECLLCFLFRQRRGT
jgi:hypothetical protein